MRLKWRFLNEFTSSKTGRKICVYVDYNLRKTKITSNGKTFIHDGIYPYHDPIAVKTIKSGGKY